MLSTIKTAIDQTKHLGAWSASVAMVRLVAELRDRIDDDDMLCPADAIAIDNVVTAFLATMPKKVRDEVLHG